jgi:4'-phosphopantetheinyl transferase EntD
MSALSSLFGPGTEVAAAEARLVDEQLYPEELGPIRGAVRSRRAEFGMGRVCARQALGRVGIAGGPIIPRRGRDPLWPEGSTGSISHALGHCAVVVGRRPPLRSVGLDVEVLRPVGEELASVVLTERERARIGASDRLRLDQIVLTVFCAKEAFYKCQYPVTETFLEFHDVEVKIFDDERRFVARVLAPPARVAEARATELTGRIAYDGDRVFCGVELRDR